MSERVLITGGAGFIGSHLARGLLAEGSEVRVLDDLNPQVHPAGERPACLDPGAELIVDDVRDRDAVRRALADIDVVVHLAARVGVGQSMYEMAEYTSVNGVGTATVLEAIAEHPVRKLLVASSMSIYGEGLYRGSEGKIVERAGRGRERLQAGMWEPEGPDGRPLQPISTPEYKQPALTSVYALGKYEQERMCLLAGAAYDIPTVALRFFNVYGTDQALSNPYTGVLAIFASRMLNERPPLIFEDGEQRRDFVSVQDVARACALAIERPGADGRAINVGSGMSVSVREVAQRLAAVLDRQDIELDVTGRFRVGDVRHCFADISLAAEAIGYAPEVALDDGLADLAQWLEGQTPDDRVDSAAAELAARGLTL
ncbi:MAG TPA: NAD-dependent epimerase/dehydratase family protein [Solirubrobacteraceae bacterium]|nr:NAD-dependent epimerase/dehydratase family protein [Solirubrobacteraceae bacterium]